MGRGVRLSLARRSGPDEDPPGDVSVVMNDDDGDGRNTWLY